MRHLLLVLIVCVSAGCKHYVTPGSGVALGGIHGAGIDAALQREPASPLPARVVTARLQSSGYLSQSNTSYSHGRFSVVTARDVETEADFERLAATSTISALAPLTRMLLPQRLDDLQTLRAASAELKADLLIVYSIDTAFRTDVGRVGPLQAISLGFLPNRKSHVDATTSAMVVDVRSGFVWGVAEATASHRQRSDYWGTRAAIERARFAAESESFGAVVTQLVDLFESLEPVQRSHSERYVPGSPVSDRTIRKTPS